MNRPRIKIIAGSGLLALALTAAGVAWACTPQAYIHVAPKSAPAGTTINVSGGGWNQTGPVLGGGSSGPVEIRWGRPDGSPTASTDGPSFSVSIKVPENSSPGVYYIVASQVTTDSFGNQSERRTSDSFTVQGASSAGPGNGSATFSGTSTGSFSGGDAQQGGANQGGSGQGAAVQAPADGRTGGLAAPAGALAGSNASAAQASSAGSGGSGPGGGGSGPPDSGPGGPPPAGGEGAGVPADGGAVESVGPVKTVMADLWSGFASRNRVSLGADDAVESDGLLSGDASRQAAVWSGLVMLGVASLAMGFAVGEMRRRRAAGLR